nr:hypothetical protein [Amycolatopsis aidingensis]
MPDRTAAAVEIARVRRPGRQVRLRSNFSGELEDRRWFRYFLRARQLEDRMFPSFEEVVTVFGAAG